jgi:hypothetical protein
MPQKDFCNTIPPNNGHQLRLTIGGCTILQSHSQGALAWSFSLEAQNATVESYGDDSGDVASGPQVARSLSRAQILRPNTCTTDQPRALNI